MLDVNDWCVLSHSHSFSQLLISHFYRRFTTATLKVSVDDLANNISLNHANLVFIDVMTVDTHLTYQLVQQLASSQPSCRVILLQFPPKRDARLFLQHDIVAGMFTLESSLPAIEKGISRIRAGGKVFDDVLNSSTNPATDTGYEKLTLREREVLRALLSGSTNIDIATQLKVSESTIKTHLYRAFKKIGVSSRGQAIVWGQRHIYDMHVE